MRNNAVERNGNIFVLDFLYYWTSFFFLYAKPSESCLEKQRTGESSVDKFTCWNCQARANSTNFLHTRLDFFFYVIQLMQDFHCFHFSFFIFTSKNSFFRLRKFSVFLKEFRARQLFHSLDCPNSCIEASSYKVTKRKKKLFLCNIQSLCQNSKKEKIQQFSTVSCFSWH